MDIWIPFFFIGREMGFDLLTLCAPILKLMPAVPKPGKKVDINKRLFYTFVSLSLYLACTLIPLFGVKKIFHEDPMYHLRVITASSKFTLMEFGISPIVSSGMILQFLSAFGLIQRNPNDPARAGLFEAAQKLSGILMTVLQASNAIFSGEYGPKEEIGIITSILILGQLVCSAVVVILLDELCQNGYGIGSGISLFIATNICEQIMWRLFSFNTYQYGRGTEYEGAMIAFFHLLYTRKNKLHALREVVFRSHLPNLSSLFSTVLIFGAVVLLEHIKIDIPLSHTIAREGSRPFEIKLFYTSNTPIIVQSTIISQLSSFSRQISYRWPDSPVTKLFGVWRSTNNLGSEYARPVSGLVYYLQAPMDIRQALRDPFHTIIYLIMSLSSAGLIAYYYIYVAGTSPKEVAEQLHNQKLTITGHRFTKENIEKTLNRYIPAAAALGGILTSLLSFIADFLGAFGSGTGIILAVSIMYQFSEELTKEIADNNKFAWLLK